MCQVVYATGLLDLADHLNAGLSDQATPRPCCLGIPGCNTVLQATFATRLSITVSVQYINTTNA